MTRSDPQTTKTLAPEARQLIDKVCELDEQYRAGIIKAKDLDDFINRHIVPLVEEYAKALGIRKRKAADEYCHDNPARLVSDCLHCGEECRG
jgi:hypothetical protein